MKPRNDPFELLQRLRSTANRGPLEVGENPQAEQLLQSLRASTSTRRRARRWWIPVTVSVGIAGAAGAVALQRRSEQTSLTSIICYSEAKADPAAQYQVGLDVAVDPRQSCQEPWTNGEFGKSGNTNLTACLNDHGLVTVVPGGTGVCERIGLRAYAPANGPNPEAALLARELDETLGPICADEATTRRLVQQVLDRQHLDNWTISVTTPFDDQRRCGVASIDDSGRVVDIVPIPKPPIAP